MFFGVWVVEWGVLGCVGCCLFVGFGGVRIMECFVVVGLVFGLCFWGGVGWMCVVCFYLLFWDEGLGIVFLFLVVFLGVGVVLF